MTKRREPLHTGGCQCGAVRYALYAEPFDPHLCHCRMCQKAFGSLFAPLASVALGDIAWTRGAPSVFASSNLAERGFCPKCGTPLCFRYTASDRIAIAIGSLDAPARVRPANNYGAEAMVSWFGDLHTLPASRTENDMPPDWQAKLAGHQHPDRDD